MQAHRTHWHPNAHQTPFDALRGKYDVEDRGYETPCWIWNCSVTTSGRAQVRFQMHMFVAYRLAYEAYVGPIPDGLELDHLCREPLCCNPQHLEPVSGHENRCRAGQVKLDDDAVREIRRLLAEGVYQKDIARRFNVTQPRISQIKRGIAIRKV